MAVTTDRNDPRLKDVDPATGLQAAYIVLSDEELAKGFVRPVRDRYKHVGPTGCGTVTTMGATLSETYARQPDFYGATYCCGCQKHLPVGEHGEFDWLDGTKVGS